MRYFLGRWAGLVLVVMCLASSAWGDEKKTPKTVKEAKGYHTAPLSGAALGGQGSTYGVPGDSGGVLFKTPFQPTAVRVGIFGEVESRPKLVRLRLFLEQEASLSLNKRLGMRMLILGWFEGQVWHQEQLVRYRDGFLRAALLIADAMDGRQIVKRVDTGSLPEGVDVLIELGSLSLK